MLGPEKLEVKRPRASSWLSPVQGRRRSVSVPRASRPLSTNHAESENEGKRAKRRSWLPGAKGKSRVVSQQHDVGESVRAWVLADSHQIDYSLDAVLDGERVSADAGRAGRNERSADMTQISELWDERPEANMYVYLHHQSTGRGPQIKCHPFVVQSSQVLLDLLYDHSAAHGVDGRNRLSSERATRQASLPSAEQAPRTSSLSYSEDAPATPVRSGDHSGSDNESPRGESIRSYARTPPDFHLYFPVELARSTSDGAPGSDAEAQKLVEARNLFAFLLGQPLVSTHLAPSIFNIFLAIGDALKKFGFYNLDGTTFGETVDASFGGCIAEMRLADVRLSREKTVESLLLAERMRSPSLYNEVFAHAVGKFASIQALNLPIFHELSQTTRLQLQNASRDLVRIQDAVNQRLADFEFPSMFSGIASSTSMDEAKVVRFKTWKANFLAMRRHVMTFYKNVYGQWPPKASTNKNLQHGPGLNRIVLQCLYTDLCALYDLLVDRTALTTRGMSESEDREDSASVTTPQAAALRKLLSEYDRSSPPVQPPIPFDTPLIATMAVLEPRYNTMSPKDQHKLANRRLKSHELGLLQERSHNQGVDLQNPLVQSFRDFELKEGKGKSALELQEQRFGHWIFLYAVIQSLPLLVTDATGVQFTDGVEYFLCQAPVNSSPWVEDRGRMTKAWYGVAGGAVVNMPSHTVENSVEAVYARSHCWHVAAALVESEAAPAAVDEPPYVQCNFGDGMGPLELPPLFGEQELRPRSVGYDGVGSPSHRGRSRNGSRQSNHRGSSAWGLERLPAGYDHSERPRSRGGSMVSPMTPLSRGTSPSYIPGGRAASRGGDSPRTTATKGESTFDAILDSMKGTGPEKDKKKTKKLGFF